MIEEINDIVFVPTASGVGLTSDTVQFITAVFKGPSGYSDSKLRSLLEMNMLIGIEVARALVSTHLREASVQSALTDFACEFRRFVLYLPKDAKESYEWSMNARMIRV
jgi:hypothetical protein